MPRDEPAREAGAKERTVAQNREARFQYEILDKYEAGIVLSGSEVKSARAAGVNLSDSHVRVDRGEAWLVGCHVSPYPQAGREQHDPVRARKLLLHAREIEKLARALDRQGLAVVPLRVYFKGSRVKVEIAVGRGRKLHDKRAAIRRREEERAARR